MTVLVFGERSELFLALLHDRNVDAVAAEEPAGDALAGASAVLLAGRHGAPPPDAVWDVLAAGRLLVAPRVEPSRGLEPGIDHLSAGTDGELADLAAMAVKFPKALEPVVAMGRLKARMRGLSA
jgi:hypothetical protein